MVYNRNHKEKPNVVDGQLIIQTSQIQRICITVDRYLSNVCKSFMHCSPWLFTTRNVEIYIQSMRIAVDHCSGLGWTQYD